jgi:hypothetical protein
LNQDEFNRVSAAIDLAIHRVLSKGTDDVFRPPIFSHSIESEISAVHAESFRRLARSKAIDFLRAADLQRERIGPTRRGLVSKDQNTFRQVAWLDPFDAVKYLSVAILLFPEIESARVPREDGIVHSHRLSYVSGEVFDDNFGYDSFKTKSSELSKARVGKWKVVTDIANFFDRIGNHPLENHLLDIGCDQKYVRLVREILFFWAGDRRSFGIPVGSDASRILSEAALIDVDRKLIDRGVTYIRYVDDYRIFADTHAEALKCIELLTSALADEGLALNSRKTDIARIVDAEEIASFTNRFVGGEHEKINLEERIEVKHAVRVSGRSTISRFYREPGKLAAAKIKAIPREKIDSLIRNSPDADFEQQLKLAVKYFIYADQDAKILGNLIDRKVTTIFYISDALVKEFGLFSSDVISETKKAVFDSFDWSRCAYPLQVPIIRLAAHKTFLEPKFVRAIFDGHLQSDCMLFYREAISLGYPCLDRARLRALAIEVFQNVPDFVQRAIYCAVRKHEGLTEDEKRPLLRNMKQHANDWFIELI